MLRTYFIRKTLAWYVASGRFRLMKSTESVVAWAAQADADWHRPENWVEKATPNMVQLLETGIELDNMYSFKVNITLCLDGPFGARSQLELQSS